MSIKTVAVVAVLFSLPASAWANCARDVQDITPKISQIKDTDTRQKAQDYLDRAQRELQENDEFECQSAVDAVGKLLPPDATKAHSAH